MKPLPLKRPVAHVDTRPRVHAGTLDNVEGRFSRRLGEQVPDAHYACAIERPHPLNQRRLQTLVCWLTLGGMVAALLAALAAS